MNLAKLGILMALNVYMFKFCRSGFKFVKVSARVYVADQKCGCTSRVRTPATCLCPEFHRAILMKALINPVEMLQTG